MYSRLLQPILGHFVCDSECLARDRQAGDANRVLVEVARAVRINSISPPVLVAYKQGSRYARRADAVLDVEGAVEVLDRARVGRGEAVRVARAVGAGRALDPEVGGARVDNELVRLRRSADAAETRTLCQLRPVWFCSRSRPLT